MPVRSLTTTRYTTAPPPPDAGPRARTYRRLIDAGMKLVQQRGLVTVAEVASAANGFACDRVPLLPEPQPADHCAR